MKKIVFMYSGEGSQYNQMGKNLFENNVIFKEKLLQGDRICRDLISVSILDYLYNNSEDKNETSSGLSLTTCAIYLIELALSAVLLEKGLKPNIVLGASMGEYSAAVAAQAVPYEIALQAIINQAKVTARSTNKGGMIAILANQKIYYEKEYLNQYSHLAAINYDNNFVVAANEESIKLIMDKLKEENIMHQLLPVSRPFHSSLIDDVKDNFLNSLKNLVIERPKITFVSCAKANKIEDVSAEHFWAAVRDPIYFQATIKFLEGQDCYHYIDLGPSGTLSTFVKYNLSPESRSAYHTIMSPLGGELKNLHKLLSLHL